MTMVRRVANEYTCGVRFLEDLKRGDIPSQFSLHERALEDLYMLLIADQEALECLRLNEMRILLLAADKSQIKELLELIEPWQTE